MSELICKIADYDEIIQKWDYEISLHPNDENWLVWRENSLKRFNNDEQLCYIGVLDGEIITQATAILTAEGLRIDGGMQNPEGLVGSETAYLSAFRTREEFQNRGYFSRLYRFMELDLYNRGCRTLTLGVEPNEIKNRKIYFKYGFTHFIKSAVDTYPDGERIKVDYYSKTLY